MIKIVVDKIKASGKNSERIQISANKNVFVHWSVINRSNGKKVIVRLTENYSQSNATNHISKDRPNLLPDYIEVNMAGIKPNNTSGDVINQFYDKLEAKIVTDLLALNIDGIVSVEVI